MARVKEIVSLDGKRGTRIVAARGKRSSRAMTKEEVDHKNQKNRVMVFGNLGKDTNQIRKYKSTTGRTTRYYTGGGF